jgi:hypothetical protein
MGKAKQQWNVIIKSGKKQFIDFIYIKLAKNVMSRVILELNKL